MEAKIQITVTLAEAWLLYNGVKYAYEHPEMFDEHEAIAGILESLGRFLPEEIE